MDGRAHDNEFLRDFADRWGRAWDSHDPQQVLDLVDPDITWDDTIFWPRVIHGVDELREYVEQIYAVMPDVSFEEVQFFSAPEGGRALWLFQQSGSAPERFGGGKRFRNYGCDIFLGFKDGRLSNYLAQYDLIDMMRQYDALPPREERIGGAYLLSLLYRTPPRPEAREGADVNDD